MTENYTRHKKRAKNTHTIIKPKQNETYYKKLDKWKDINDGQTQCPTCLKPLLEDEAMEAPTGQRIHEDCYEPGENNY